jgi:hypothetical protein
MLPHWQTPSGIASRSLYCLTSPRSKSFIRLGAARLVGMAFYKPGHNRCDGLSSRLAALHWLCGLPTPVRGGMQFAHEIKSESC